jgi:hypothetical protein
VTRRQTVLVALGGGVILIAGFALGFVLSSRNEPEPTPTPTPPAAVCQVSVSPTTIEVDPDTGDSSDVLSFAGSGFPPDSAVSIDFAPQPTVFDDLTTAEGDFTTEVPAAVDTTHPAPPDLEAGPQTWTVIGWDSPSPPADDASQPQRACEVEVTVTIELTGAPSATPGGSPPTDLVPGGYAEVLADGVRVRIEPSLDSTVTGALFIGDVVRILEPAQAAEGLIWYRVESVVIASGDYVRGYVAAAGPDGTPYLAPTEEPPPPTPSPSPTPAS